MAQPRADLQRTKGSVPKIEQADGSSRLDHGPDLGQQTRRGPISRAGRNPQELWTATVPSLGAPSYHPSWYQAQLPRQVLSLSKCQFRKHCKPKNSDYQRPCKVKRSHGVVLSETCTFRGPSPGVGDQVKAATRTSQVSQVTSRAPALRLCSHQSSLLSP